MSLFIVLASHHDGAKALLCPAGPGGSLSMTRQEKPSQGAMQESAEPPGRGQTSIGLSACKSYTSAPWSRARPGERRSVHKLAKMASRSCFGSFVYTVATREGHARGRGDAGVYTNWQKWPLGAVLGHLCTLLRLARVMRKWRRREAGVFTETATHTNPEESSIETGQVSEPIDARFGRFWLVGRLWCVERCARLTKRAVPDALHDPLAQDVPSPHESEAHYRRDVAEHVELDELPDPPMTLGPIPEGYASSPSLRGASRRQRLGSG